MLQMIVFFKVEEYFSLVVLIFRSFFAHIFERFSSTFAYFLDVFHICVVKSCIRQLSLNEYMMMMMMAVYFCALVRVFRMPTGRLIANWVNNPVLSSTHNNRLN